MSVSLNCKRNVAFNKGLFRSLLVGLLSLLVSSLSLQAEIRNFNFVNEEILKVPQGEESTFGEFSVSTDGGSLNLEGDIWAIAPLEINITPTTVLSFDFSSPNQGGFHGLGFANGVDDVDLQNMIKVFGINSLGIKKYSDYYKSRPNTKRYVIPIGAYYTGSFSHIAFINDDDYNQNKKSIFSNITIEDVLSQDELIIEQGVVNNVSNEWQIVNFEKTNRDPIVVCTPIYNKDNNPVVPSIRNVTSYSFELKMTPGSFSDNVVPVSVSYMAVSEGVYSQASHGVKLQAHKVTLNSTELSKMKTLEEYWQNYEKPVAFGQVITSNENSDEFQSFVSSAESMNKPASGVAYYVGRTFGQSSSENRVSQEVGCIVFESGVYRLPDSFLEVKVSQSKVRGLGSGHTSMNIDMANLGGVVLSLAGLRGEGGFPVLAPDQFDPHFLDNGLLKLAIDEDTFVDEERYHTWQYLSLALFSKTRKPVIDPSPVAIFPPEGGTVSVEPPPEAHAHYEFDVDHDPTSQSPVYVGPIDLYSDTTFKAVSQVENEEFVSEIAQTEVVISPYPADSVGFGFIQTTFNWPFEGSKSTLEYVPDLSNASLNKVESVESDLKVRTGKYTITRVESILRVPESDTYEFYFFNSRSAAAKFYIDDMNVPIVSSAIRGHYRILKSVYLEKGFHPIKIDFVVNYWGGEAGMTWKNSTRDEIIPLENLIYKYEDLEARQGLLDTDGDGLTDLEEQTYGTSLTSTDTDGDGISDKDEILTYKTDPLSADTDGDGINDYYEALIYGSLGNVGSETELNEVLTINAAEFISKKGRWRKDGDTLVSKGFRGDVTYQFETQEDDMYILDLLGRASEYKYLSKMYDLAVWVDDQYVGERTLRNSESDESRTDHYAMNFSGSLDITESGNYSFKLGSDDGSQLFIDDQLVIDNDGCHSYKSKYANIELSTGTHSIEVTYFEAAGQDRLEVYMAKPASGYKRISSADLKGTLEWNYYEGEWTALPDFSFLVPVKTGECYAFDLDARKSLAVNHTSYILPWLKAGAHTVRVKWNNGIHDRKLKLEKLILKSVAGEDLDSNGIKDWIDNKLTVDCGINDVSTSKISPVCVEGKGDFVDLMSLSNGGVVESSVYKKWYANIELDPVQETDLDVSFQNGAKTISKSISWSKTYVPEEESMTIRVGDSLLLSPSLSSSTDAGSIVISGNTYDVGQGEAMAYTFDEPLEYEVTAFYTDEEGVVSSSTMLVVAVDVDLPVDPFVCIVGNERKMDFSSYSPSGVIFEGDSRLNSWYATQSGEMAFGLDSAEERNVLLRLGKEGPILGVIKLQGIEVFGAGKTSFWYSKSLEDGTLIMNLKLVAAPVLESMEVNMKIILAGVTCLDGTTNKIFLKDDFNEVDETTVVLLKTPEAHKTAACHHIDIYQNGEYVGRVY
ncbi:MAG: hypothetical protein HQL32_03695 [Planctomycetes bacterium]|nr:hypothetical protein [Planctomycetota bacterium]